MVWFKSKHAIFFKDKDPAKTKTKIKNCEKKISHLIKIVHQKKKKKKKEHKTHCKGYYHTSYPIFC